MASDCFKSGRERGRLHGLRLQRALVRGGMGREFRQRGGVAVQLIGAEDDQRLCCCAAVVDVQRVAARADRAEADDQPQAGALADKTDDCEDNWHGGMASWGAAA